MPDKILVIDEDKDFLPLVVEALGWGDYQMFSSASAKAGIIKARKLQPDLIVLSLFDKENHGVETCEALKGDKATAGIPLIVLVHNESSGHDITFLDKGADDFIVTKPSDPDPDMWLARCRVQLRRRVQKRGASSQPVKIGDMTLVRSAKLVCIDGREYPHLTPKEFDVLYYLAQRSPKPIDPQTLHREVWGKEPLLVEGFKKGHGTVLKPDMGKVEVCIHHIREKLGISPKQRLVNVSGRGYALVPLTAASAVAPRPRR